MNVLVVILQQSIGSPVGAAVFLSSLHPGFSGTGFILMNMRDCPVSEEEFLEACRIVADSSFLLQESRMRFRAAIVKGALIEAGTSFPAFFVGGLMEAILSSGLFACQITPHVYHRLFGCDAALLKKKILRPSEDHFFCTQRYG